MGDRVSYRGEESEKGQSWVRDWGEKINEGVSKLSVSEALSSLSLCLSLSS